LLPRARADWLFWNQNYGSIFFKGSPPVFGHFKVDLLFPWSSCDWSEWLILILTKSPINSSTENSVASRNLGENFSKSRFFGQKEHFWAFSKSIYFFIILSMALILFESDRLDPYLKSLVQIWSSINPKIFYGAFSEGTFNLVLFLEINKEITPLHGKLGFLTGIIKNMKKTKIIEGRIVKLTPDDPKWPFFAYFFK